MSGTPQQSSSLLTEGLKGYPASSNSNTGHAYLSKVESELAWTAGQVVGQSDARNILLGDNHSADATSAAVPASAEALTERLEESSAFQRHGTDTTFEHLGQHLSESADDTMREFLEKLSQGQILIKPSMPAVALTECAEGVSIAVEDEAKQRDTVHETDTRSNRPFRWQRLTSREEPLRFAGESGGWLEPWPAVADEHTFQPPSGSNSDILVPKDTPSFEPAAPRSDTEHNIAAGYLSSHTDKQKPIVQRGFGGFMKLPAATLEGDPQTFPPLSNASYDLTTYGVDLKLHAKLQERRRAEYEEALLSSMRRHDTPDDSPMLKRLGDLANPEKPGFADRRPSKDLNLRGDDMTKEFCGKCRTRHIVPGPPITLQERDTCLSMLPEWFPADKYEKPWESFIEMINKYVNLCEKLQECEETGFRDKPWDLEYHEPTPEWRAVGRYGGWWRCRTNPNDGDPYAPQVERNCAVCKVRVEAEPDASMTRSDKEVLLEKKKRHEDWISQHMKLVMGRDRAFAEAEIRRTMW